MTGNSCQHTLLSSAVIVLICFTWNSADGRQHAHRVLRTTAAGRVMEITIAREHADSPVVSLTVSLHQNDRRELDNSNETLFRELKLSLEVDKVTSVEVADWQQQGVLVLWSGRESDENVYGWATGDGKRQAEGRVPRTARMKTEDFVVRAVWNCSGVPCGDTLYGILESTRSEKQELIYYVNNCASIGTATMTVGEIRHLLPSDPIMTVDK